MAIIQGIITVRLGKEMELDITKLLPGEFGFTTDTKRLFIGTTSGAKEIPFVGYANEFVSPEQLQEAVNNYLKENPVSGYIVDSELSEISLNPVQNKVVAAALKELQEKESNALPKVTEDDNGAFLRVINGEWKKSMLRIAEEVEF